MTLKQPFQTVVSEHGPTVLRVCRVLVGPVDGDDAWSETFLSALKAYPDLPADANVTAWLVTIAHRKAIDILRSRARHAVPTDALPEYAAAPGDADHHGEHQDLIDAVNRLSPKQKQAVAYHYLAGLPYTEVADITGSSPAAARRAAADGIAALRRRLSTTSAAAGAFTKGQHS
ncbi:ECF subfamily RNA polymerase sigma-24 factor [Mycolicibacterium canariasense]|uniref:ECF subfamily RNA polymerase sigma-24 factor n=1 Tax=Mycolicibacterium canariasense TaxID=228230 RepID=A0A100WFF6_MYCCR|nr:RNA polymerase sigma factor [Mycolicibacterium canariasense]MCV7213281.1 RNA polymerase sigma factor [Mycolicibacterium canariasense]ORV05141.1 RNA polymerase subunit sigma [Mycolicibacterium canariasense]GAS96848.1 ECF subfamily RNA polymerase sigma-24 factor [Mycolicibacterium canariasense]